MDDWDRHVQFEACFNFRDLGGYATVDQREVRRGVLYRSDSLHRLSPADLARLAALPIRAVIDLRTHAELDEHGRVADHDTRRFEHIPCEDGSDDYLQPRADIYLAFAQLRSVQIASVFRFIAYEEGPIAFHCFSGKDRTGVVSALLLSALGVPDAVIAEDFELSDRSLPPATAWAEAHDTKWSAWIAAAPPGVLSSPAEAMLEFLEKVRAGYGSIDGYFATTGIDTSTLEKLRARYLI